MESRYVTNILYQSLANRIDFCYLHDYLFPEISKLGRNGNSMLLWKNTWIIFTIVQEFLEFQLYFLQTFQRWNYK